MVRVDEGVVGMGAGGVVLGWVALGGQESGLVVVGVVNFSWLVPGSDPGPGAANKAAPSLMVNWTVAVGVRVVGVVSVVVPNEVVMRAPVVRVVTAATVSAIVRSTATTLARPVPRRYPY